MTTTATPDPSPEAIIELAMTYLRASTDAAVRETDADIEKVTEEQYALMLGAGLAAFDWSDVAEGDDVAYVASTHQPIAPWRTDLLERVQEELTRDGERLVAQASIPDVYADAPAEDQDAAESASAAELISELLRDNRRSA
ncbi:hypothetical protein [Nocardioides sp. MH1]|uniref:hypothetical protein n=1 Tax=Nocardioides sp. MH1 TaxID=3242490 RepID=UPI00352234CA